MYRSSPCRALLRFGPMNARWLVLVGFYLLLGLLGAWYLMDTTQAGADLATYQRAGDALWTTGDPYANAAAVP
jgi:ABC-type transporter lipoprotein component MlaA